MADRKSVSAFFQTHSRQPLPFRDLADRMGLARSEHRALKHTLREMVDDGELIRTKRGMYGPAEQMELITGYFEAHGDGYGFVIQEKPGQEDVFIPARMTKSAMDSDRVVARIDDTRRRSGTIVRILDRAHTRVAGIVERQEGMYFVRPKGRRVNFHILIPENALNSAKEGDTVISIIEEYPSGERPAIGSVLKVLDAPEDPRSEILSIIEEFSLPRRFPPAVTAAAKALYDLPLEDDTSALKRRDLTDLNTVTIDGESAKDFDDAISIRRSEDGYHLWVSIADVGHYVPWDSPIDLEARARGTSVYFPDRVIPMLPKALSEDLCSLRPEVPRPAFTAEMTFNSHGKPRSSKFYRSTIRSNARMTYTSVAKIVIDFDEEERAKYAPLVEDFELMAELARLMRKLRMARGSLDFDLPEPEILLDLQGVPENVVRAERNFAHMIIEEFMIAANEAVATFLESRNLPNLYRIHEEPDERKITDLIRNAPLRIKRPRKVTADSLHLMLQQAEGQPGAEEFSFMVLRSLKQARYSQDNVGHFGLASESYSHFTSPIRRYPDLVVHRILAEVLAGNGKLPQERKQWLIERLPEIAFESSRLERVAMEAERASVAAMRAWFMLDKVGLEYEARVMSVTPKGFRLRLKEYFIEGYVTVSELGDDFYRFDETTSTLRGRHTGKSFSFGKVIRVRVDRVVLDERMVIFGVVDSGVVSSAAGEPGERKRPAEAPARSGKKTRGSAKYLGKKKGGGSRSRGPRH